MYSSGKTEDMALPCSLQKRLLQYQGVQEEECTNSVGRKGVSLGGAKGEAA